MIIKIFFSGIVSVLFFAGCANSNDVEQIETTEQWKEAVNILTCESEEFGYLYKHQIAIC